MHRSVSIIRGYHHCLCSFCPLHTSAVCRWQEYDNREYLAPGETPVKRTLNTFKFEWERYRRRMKDVQNDPYERKQYATHLSPSNIYRHELIPYHADFVVIGGGIVGSAVAWWLKQRLRDEDLHVCVVENDDTFTRGSTVLSAGGIRQQFSLPENVQMSLFGAEFMRNAGEHLRIDDNDPPDLNIVPMGYLFLASTPESAEQMEQNWKIQTELGAKVALLNKDELKQRFPFMKFDDIVLGSLGLENEGAIDAWQFLQALREKNITLGVYYVKAKVEGFLMEPAPRHNLTTDPVTGQIYKRISQAIVKPQKTDSAPRPIRAMKFVNCAGPWAGQVAALAGIGTGKGLLSVPVPVEPRKRYVYVIHCPDGPSLDMPFLIDPTGVWCRREDYGHTYICGCSPTEEEDSKIDHSNLDVDYDYFYDRIWPVLAARMPAFEKLKVKSAWAGYYDYNYFDQNAIIGPHFVYDNFHQVCGFSGHGLQHAMAAGRSFMEQTYDGAFVTINLRKFGMNRILKKKPLNEVGIV